MKSKPITGKISNNKVAIIIHGVRFWDTSQETGLIGRNYINRFSKLISNYYEKVFVIKYADYKLGTETVNEINNFISLHIDEKYSIDIFGHSKGGLIAVYASIKYVNLNNRINKIFAICSPFGGASLSLKSKIGKLLFSKPYKIWKRVEVDGYEELYNKKNDKNSIVSLINNNLNYLSNKISYITIGTNLDETVRTENSFLKSKFANVKNLVYEIKEKSKNIENYYSHSGFLEYILHNSFDNLLKAIIDDNAFKIQFDERNKQVHFINNCRTVDIKLISKYNYAYKVCENCIQKSYADIDNSTLIKGNEESKRVLIILIDQNLNKSQKLLKLHMVNLLYYDAVICPNLDEIKKSPNYYSDIIDFFQNDDVKFDILICDDYSKKHLINFLKATEYKSKSIIRVIFINCKIDNEDFDINNYQKFICVCLNCKVSKNTEEVLFNRTIIQFDFEKVSIKQSFEGINIFEEMDTNGFIELFAKIISENNWNDSNHLLHISGNCPNTDIFIGDHFCVCNTCIEAVNNLK